MHPSCDLKTILKEFFQQSFVKTSRPLSLKSVYDYIRNGYCNKTGKINISSYENIVQSKLYGHKDF